MMLGILSDTHGQTTCAARALALLRRLGASSFVHCGDIGSYGVLDELAAVRARFVWGNTDEHDLASLRRYADRIGLSPPGAPPLRFEFEGRAIEVYHGHEPEFESRIREAEKGAGTGLPDIIFYGHTHRALDRTIGRVRFVNPGALHRARTYTVATYDPVLNAVEYWRVDDEPASDAAPRPFTPE